MIEFAATRYRSATRGKEGGIKVRKFALSMQSSGDLNFRGMKRKEQDLPRIDSGDQLERCFSDDRLSGNANYVKNSASRIMQENKEKKITHACFASSSKKDVSACESRIS